MSSDERAIEDLVAGQVPLMRAKDAAGLVARYAPGVVTFSLAPPLLNDGPQLRDPAGLRAWLDTFADDVDYEVRDVSVTVGGDVAFCHSLNRLSATSLAANEHFDLWFRSTLGLRKVDGAWLIAHEHQSTPFYMDGSFRAAVDLKP
jgi:ketosteroid isomerase-like protein